MTAAAGARIRTRAIKLGLGALLAFALLLPFVITSGVSLP